MIDTIKILSLDIFRTHKKEMDFVESIQKYFNIGIGWHYYLDLAWMVNTVKNLPMGSLLLDAGAGSGLSQFILAELGFNVVSVDFANRQFPKQILKRYESVIHYLNDQSVVFDNLYTRHLENTYKLKVSQKQAQGNYPENHEGAKQLIEKHGFKPKLRDINVLSTVLSENVENNCGRIFIYKSDLRNMFLIPDNYMDGVVSISALEHNDHENFQKCVSELHRVTKNSGLLAVTVSASLKEDWLHEQSKGWCYSESSLNKLFRLQDDVKSNYSNKDKFFEQFKKENNELHKRLAPFYFKSGDNGMPWGKWNPQYLPVGIIKIIDKKQRIQPESEPLVSIIMPNYNYAAFVKEAIESVIAQTYENWELIIVDDGSTDDSVAVIDQYWVKYPQKIIPIYKKNGGQASAFNAGFSKCCGEIVCFLDSDDYWSPAKLERIVQAHKQYDFVQHNLLKEDKPYRKFEHYENHFDLMTKKGLFDFFVPTSGLSFKRTVLSQIFPIPEPELKICADAYVTRMALYFSKLKILDEVLGYYRVHSSNAFFNNLQKKQTGIIYDILGLVNRELKKSDKPLIPFKRPSTKNMIQKVAFSTLIASKTVSKHVQISIVIPTYNRLDFITRTLESMEGLNYPKSDFEVIVVDDGSSDGTYEYMLKYSKTTKLNFSFISQKNSGPAAARNVGLKYAKGKYVAYTDSDCIVDKNWLWELLKGFTSDDIAGVGGSAEGVGDDIFSRYFAQTGMYSTRVLDGTVAYLLTLNACYRKDILQLFNGFNEEFKQPGGEDPDLSFRIRKKGYLLAYNPKAIVYHHHKASTKSFLKTFRNYGKGQALLVKLHPEWYIKENIQKSFLGIIARRFYRVCRSKGLDRKDSFVFGVLRYTQDMLLYGNMYLRQMHMRNLQITPVPWEKKLAVSSPSVATPIKEPKKILRTGKPEHMNVVLNFHKGDQLSAKLMLELFMAVEEGIDCTYYLQYGGEPTSLTISETILKFVSKKRAYFSNELPDIKVPDSMIKQDPNLLQYPEIAKLSPTKTHWWQSRARKLKVLQWNLCVYKYINKLESFLMVEPDAVILRHGWLKEIYAGWINDDAPIFGHLKKGKINGKYVPTHWAGSSVYDCSKLRTLPLDKYFYERYPNPWWQYISQPDTTLANNCFWGPMFSGYDVSYDYFLFGLFWKEKTGSNNPSDWHLDELTSREDLILCDWDSKMTPSEIIHRYSGKLSMLHGVKGDEIREIMIQHFLNVGKPSDSKRFRGGPDRELNQSKFNNIIDLKNRYHGKRCFIIGNGPSLKKTDLRLLKDEFTIGTNRIYLNYDNMGFDPTFYCSVNPNVIEQFGHEIDQLSTVKFLRWDSQKHLKNMWSTFFMKSLDHTGFNFNKDIETLEWYEGGTVTYCAMQVAYYLGFSTVILIGVDHFFQEAGEPNKLVTAQTEDPNHFHPGYFGKGIKWQYPDLERSEQAYRIAKKAFEEDGRVILDATVGGHLQVFPKVDYLTVVKDKTPAIIIEKELSQDGVKLKENIPYKFADSSSGSRIAKLQQWLGKISYDVNKN